MNIKDLPMANGFDFKYYRHEEIRSFLEDIQKNYPDLMNYEVIGKTYEGRDIFAATITQMEKDHREKPAYYLDANIHAGEVTGSTAALYMIYYLCSMYGEQQTIKKLLDTFTFYIIPRISADGSEIYLTKGLIHRSSTRIYPFPEKLPGFHREDINGDGEIILMRVEDPLGDWKVSDKDPRLMLKRAMDDFGEGPFYRLYPEGMLHEWKEGDPVTMAPPKEGLDLNRNNPAGPWAQEFKQQGAGPFPLSESETRTIADFFRDHPNICGAQSYHTFSGAILRPYAFTEDMAMEDHDLEFFETLGKIGEDLTGYPLLNIFKDFKYERKKDMLGGFLDWIFEKQGIFIYSTELWDMIKEAGVEDRDFIRFLMYERSEEDELKLLKWNDEVLDGKGFVNWHEYEHPQLGKVELGGWKFRYTFQNPPLDKGYLETICHSNTLFSLTHAALNPVIKFGKHSCEQIGEDSWRITLEIVNSGFLPTNVSQQALSRKVVLPNILSIECEKGEVLTPNKEKINVPHLQGRSNKMRNNLFGGLSPEDQKFRYDVLIRADKGSKVIFKIKTDRAGTDDLELII